MRCIADELEIMPARSSKIYELFNLFAPPGKVLLIGDSEGPSKTDLGVLHNDIVSVAALARTKMAIDCERKDQFNRLSSDYCICQCSKAPAKTST